MLPKMIRVRQSFAGPRLTDIPRTVAERLEGAGLPVKRGETVAVGAGSRGIASIDVIVGATVRWLRDRGARPFVFPAMGSHGGGTPEGQLSVPEHYGPLPPGDAIALAANPTVVARLTGADPARVRAVARTAASPSALPPADELYRQLADLLGIASD